MVDEAIHDEISDYQHPPGPPAEMYTHARLQGPQSSSRLETWLRPPSARGVLWSSSR